MTKKFDKKHLFDKFPTAKNNAEKNANVYWDEISAIYEDYVNRMNDFTSAAQSVSNQLTDSGNPIHSTRYRAKEPYHVVEKILRKLLEKPGIKITSENYLDHIQDLAGVRVLHLYKNDWLEIDKTINDKFTVLEKSAYIRSGDSKEIKDFYSTNGCDVKEHEAGYRSVHYIVESKPNKHVKMVEIQVRTLIEEAWSEIDHTFRYPYNKENQIISSYLSLFNRMAGAADEMATFVVLLNKEFIELGKKQSDLKSKLEAALKDGADKNSIMKQFDTLQSPFLSPNISLSGLLADQVQLNPSSIFHEQVKMYTSPYLSGVSAIVQNPDYLTLGAQLTTDYKGSLLNNYTSANISSGIAADLTVALVKPALTVSKTSISDKSKKNQDDDES